MQPLFRTALATTAIFLSTTAVAAQEVDVYGFVKLDLNYDLDFIQGDTTNARAIGIAGNATDGHFDTNVRQSRLGLRAELDGVEGQLEFDLFGSNGTAELRLRHANIQYEGFLLGQFWTNFMPLGQYPSTVDFNGPVGIAFARVPQVRYTYDGGAYQLSGSIEENFATSDDPLLTAAAQYSGSNYTVRAAVLGGTTNDGVNEVDQFGYTLSADAQLWQGGNISATFVDGEAIGGLLIGGGDNIVGGTANDAQGYTLAVSQDITPQFNVGIAYGNEQYDQATAFAGTDFTDLESLHVNASYDLTDSLTVSAEYARVTRTDSAGQDFEGDRIQAAVQFNF
jgi:hypothetical protein